MALGGMSNGHGATPNAEDSTPVRWKIPKWTTDQNLVLISGWIKYETDSVVGRNQKSDSYCEWLALRDQPRYDSQVGGNSGYVGSGSKRAHESDASDSNSVESSARPMGRDETKKREKEFERLDKISMRKEESNQLLKESNEAKKMKMFMKLSSKEHLDDRSKELLEKLGRDLFGN
ncbi:unnamed protein product [Vicia faba]|uniref:No apical meristem-associated C-terminal domain-containing protein n=1 Tax=Vicia faba TaxID=3906 RepID=A0AAV1ALA5_VICFA|nr:unnamed protein product [Vicia faba]